MDECDSTYWVDENMTLHCIGLHLQGEPFRGDGTAHVGEAYGSKWTWYTDEEAK